MYNKPSNIYFPFQKDHLRWMDNITFISEYIYMYTHSMYNFNSCKTTLNIYVYLTTRNCWLIYLSSAVCDNWQRKKRVYIILKMNTRILQINILNIVIQRLSHWQWNASVKNGTSHFSSLPTCLNQSYSTNPNEVEFQDVHKSYLPLVWEKIV